VQIDGLPLIIVTDTVRSEGDTLIVSTGGGNDSIDASAVATDRAALKIVAGDGNDVLKGTRFDDVLDGGMGSDTYTGDMGLDAFFDASPSASNGVDDDGDGRIDEADENEIDTLVENLGARADTTSADVGLYNDRLVIGNLLNSSGSAGFEVGKNAAVELTDAGDRWVEATVADRNPRLVLLNGVPVEAPLAGTLLLISNHDQPGVIGEVGTILGRHGVNIANFALGRGDSGAVGVVNVDASDSAVVGLLDELRSVTAIKHAWVVRV